MENYKYHPQNESELRQAIDAEIALQGNQADLNCIDTSAMRSMNNIFTDSAFNGDISRWNVSNVGRMDDMFRNCPFSGDISRWDVKKARSKKHIENMFLDCPIAENRKPLMLQTIVPQLQRIRFDETDIYDRTVNLISKVKDPTLCEIKNNAWKFCFAGEKSAMLTGDVKVDIINGMYFYGTALLNQSAEIVKKEEGRLTYLDLTEAMHNYHDATYLYWKKDKTQVHCFEDYAIEMLHVRIEPGKVTVYVTLGS